MLLGKKVVCVLPAYNAEKTLAKTVKNVPSGVVDCYILVDDCSSDRTLDVSKVLAKDFPFTIIQHGK